MSRMTPLTKNLTDLYNIDPSQKSYQYKKINTHKFNGLSTNSYPTHNSVIQNNKFQNNFLAEKNYAQKIFNDSENNNIPQNRSNSKNNINIYDYQQWQRDQKNQEMQHNYEINQLENERLKEQWRRDKESDERNERNRKEMNIQVYKDIEYFNKREEEDRKKKCL